MGKVQFHFAANEANELVHIDSVTSENRHEHKYHCIECGEEMIPRLGDVNSHHFAHKSGNETCGETYLHRLGKILLKQKFELSSFPISYMRNAKCLQSASCPFYKEEICHGDIYENFDLCRYYDTCIEEQTIKNFRADLLLTHSKKSEREPVLLEIFVTHKSTEQKKNSGQKIIELRVKDDIELRNLIDNCLKESDAVVFYGFGRKASKDVQLSNRAIHHFCLFKSGATYATNYDDTPSCDERAGNRNAIFELAMDCDYLGEVNIYDFGLAYAVKEGLQFKNCRICKYSSTRDYPMYCKMSRKFGTPPYPDQKYASNCQYYVLARQYVEELIKQLAEIPVLRIK